MMSYFVDRVTERVSLCYETRDACRIGRMNCTVRPDACRYVKKINQVRRTQLFRNSESKTQHTIKCCKKYCYKTGTGLHHYQWFIIGQPYCPVVGRRPQHVASKLASIALAYARPCPSSICPYRISIIWQVSFLSSWQCHMVSKWWQRGPSVVFNAVDVHFPGPLHFSHREPSKINVGRWRSSHPRFLNYAFAIELHWQFRVRKLWHEQLM